MAVGFNKQSNKNNKPTNDKVNANKQPKQFNLNNGLKTVANEDINEVDINSVSDDYDTIDTRDNKSKKKNKWVGIIVISIILILLIVCGVKMIMYNKENQIPNPNPNTSDNQSIIPDAQNTTEENLSTKNK